MLIGRESDRAHEPNTKPTAEVRVPTQRRARLVGTLPVVLCVVILAPLCSLFLACQETAEEDARLREPILALRTEAAQRLAQRLIRLEGTPIARLAEGFLAEGHTCPELFFRGISESSQGRTPNTPLQLACAESRADEAGLGAFARARRDTADGLLLWPLGRTGRVEFHFRIDESGRLTFNGEVTPPGELGGGRLLIPDDDAPSAPVISDANTLVHLHVRARDGLGLTEFIPKGGQADRLFALKGRLLEGALLSNTWEFAFTPPAQPDGTPLAVLALHHRSAAATQEALDQALDQLESQWPIKRSPRSFGATSAPGTQGGCFEDLPLLPGLAPCWLVTDHALLIGYRAEALIAALSPPAVASAPSSTMETNNPSASIPAAVESRDSISRADPSQGRLDLHLDRFQQVDARRPAQEGKAHPGDVFSKFRIRWAPTSNGRISVQAKADPLP